jgi:branched-chain amino acid transport system substrate-binding protein
MKNSSLRRLLGVTAAVAVFALAGCSGGTDPAKTDEEIVIGFLGPLTGTNAEIGENQVAGAEIAVEAINEAGGVDGRKIRLEVQDEGTTPDTASAAVRTLANNGIGLIAGMLSSANCLALAPQLESLGVVFVNATCTNDDLTGKDGAEAPFDRFFRVGNNDSRGVVKFAEFMAERFPKIKNYSVFAYDYVTGHAILDSYKETVEKAGREFNTLGGEGFWVPLGEQNFSLQIQALVKQPSNPETDALYLGTFGGGTGSFLQQSASYNLNDLYGVIMQNGGYYPIARTLGGEAPNVWNSYDYFYDAFDTEMNKMFNEKYEEKMGKKPTTWAYQGLQTIYAYAAAIEKAGSSNVDDVLAALPGIQYESPSGTRTIDAVTHQADGPVVMMNSVGNKDAVEGVEMLETVVVEADE